MKAQLNNGNRYRKTKIKATKVAVPYQLTAMSLLFYDFLPIIISFVMQTIASCTSSIIFLSLALIETVFIELLKIHISTSIGSLTDIQNSYFSQIKGTFPSLLLPSNK